MATTVLSGQTTVTSTATLITTGVVGASYLHLHAPAGGNNTIYVGGPDVTTSTGMELHKGTTVIVWLPESGKLYAVCSNTETLTWLLTGGR